MTRKTWAITSWGAPASAGSRWLQYKCVETGEVCYRSACFDENRNFNDYGPGYASNTNSSEQIATTEELDSACGRWVDDEYCTQ